MSRDLAHPVRLTHRRATPGETGETGSVMLMALAFVTVVMVIVVALVAFAHVGVRSTRSYEVERTRRYAVNSALDAAVQSGISKPTLGTSTTAKICYQYDLPATPTNIKLVGNGTGAAYLTVECKQTDGAGITSGATEADGGQGPRDVTFTVICRTGTVQPYTPSTEYLNCGSGNNDQILAKARVRYEIDYTKTPASERAVVPKVVTWEVRV